VVLVSVRYRFSQRFAVPVEDAFRWAIDYDPGDYGLMGMDGTRKVNRLAEDAFVLEDTVDMGKGPVTKTRLVRISPERRSYTSTHIGGPTPYSQFWFEFLPEGDEASRLDFTGLFLYPSKKKPSRAEVARMAAEERRADSRNWKNLAKAMEAELKE